MRTVRNSSRLLSGAGSPQPPGAGTPLPPAARHAGIPPAGIANPPPVDRMTDTCKNITFATSLRTVMMVRFVHYCSQYYYTDNGAFLKPSRHKPTCYLYNQIRACRNRNKVNAIWRKKWSLCTMRLSPIKMTNNVRNSCL